MSDMTAILLDGVNDSIRGFIRNTFVIGELYEDPGSFWKFSDRYKSSHWSLLNSPPVSMVIYLAYNYCESEALEKMLFDAIGITLQPPAWRIRESETKQPCRENVCCNIAQEELEPILELIRRLEMPSGSKYLLALMDDVSSWDSWMAICDYPIPIQMMKEFYNQGPTFGYDWYRTSWDLPTARAKDGYPHYKK